MVVEEVWGSGRVLDGEALMGGEEKGRGTCCYMGS